MAQIKTKGKGALPDICPVCHEEVDWEYEEIQIDGDTTWQEITCPNCESEFCEYYDLTGWELVNQVEPSENDEDD